VVLDNSNCHTQDRNQMIA